MQERGVKIKESYPIRVCRMKRKKSGKVFKGMATEGKSMSSSKETGA